ncbi:hypothetical protein CJ179_16880 [Rhodococcus sp. ACS1]|uniref:hypothetical protein n=1 Tax=Rhodococcus sp. ACS1 TaxID=2028570 RepID=UPI000BB10EA0|nr:hypothetical protein [Rhodococcus sp. ACS1]PBC48488.1 hypothetical protein CJ179_16880 [Rhodococcus sp. ACS1]
MAALIFSQPHTAEIRRLCADAVPSGVIVAPQPGAAVEQDFLLLRPRRTPDDALTAQVRRVGDHDLLVRFHNRDEQLVFEFWTNSFTGAATPDDRSADLLERHCAEQFPGTLRRFRTRIRRAVPSDADFTSSLQQTYVQDGVRMTDVTVTCTLDGDVLARAWATYAQPD